MASSQEIPRNALNAQTVTDSKAGAEAVTRLRLAFERSRHPMLLVDDQRRWITANAAACELLGIDREEVPWHTMDEFTPPSERAGLEARWKAFLAEGAAEGWYPLQVPDHGQISVEFSATANVLPARHLSVLIRPEELSAEQVKSSSESGWTPVVADPGGTPQLSEREREIMTLVASGLQGGDIAKRLFLSPETIKSHVHNTMVKLGAHTRAHAVAIALVAGEITWEA